MITDGLWAAMEPLVIQAKRHKGGQPPLLPDRMFFEATLYIARTGIPLRDLPGEFGAWDAVYHRFRRWVASGALARLFELLTADPQFGEVRRVLVDSTVARARPPIFHARRPSPSAAPCLPSRHRRIPPSDIQRRRSVGASSPSGRPGSPPRRSGLIGPSGHPYGEGCPSG
jgi:transposase